MVHTIHFPENNVTALVLDVLSSSSPLASPSSIKQPSLASNHHQIHLQALLISFTHTHIQCTAMATMGTKPILLLGLLVAALVMAAAQPSDDKKNRGAVVTVYNPAGLVVDILNDDKNVKVTTETATVDLTREEQTLQFSLGGQAVDVTVRDGDLVVLIPDPADSGNVQAFKVVAAGEEPRPDVVSIPKPTTRP